MQSKAVASGASPIGVVDRRSIAVCRSREVSERDEGGRDLPAFWQFWPGFLISCLSLERPLVSAKHCKALQFQRVRNVSIARAFLLYTPRSMHVICVGDSTVEHLAIKEAAISGSWKTRV